jgi:AMMECR1 domain-containing protein
MGQTLTNNTFASFGFTSTKKSPAPPNFVVDSVLNIERSEEKTEKSPSNLPANTFGVFVTVERKHFHIHGCIGSWNSSFQVLSPFEIKKRLINVAGSAAREDSRRLQYPPLLSELASKVIVSYMVLPIHKINKHSGRLDFKVLKKNEHGGKTGRSYELAIFNNKDYGVIVTSKENSDRRATYLPDVFPNARWSDVKESLLEKAGIDSKESVEFVAYKTITQKMCLFHYLVNPFVKWIQHVYHDFVPYQVYSKGGLVIDWYQDVRNIATIHDILRLRQFDVDLKSILLKIKDNIQYYNNKRSKLNLQSLSFLLLCNKELHLNETGSEIAERLVEALSTEYLEPMFEVGEVLHGLLSYNSKRFAKIVKDYLDRVTLEATVKEDTIFQLNWLSKTAFASSIRHERLTREIEDAFKTWFSRFYSADLETNYLAVCYETLSTIFNRFSNDLDHALETVFHDLHKRRNNSTGLFAFKDGTCRLDITGHVLNGYYNFF